MTNDDITFLDSSKVEFSRFASGTKMSKPDIMGENLWNKLFERDPNFGGVTCGFYGIPGSGKTSLMLQIVKRIVKRKPNEIIFWREPVGVPIQITNLGLPVNVYSDNGSNILVKELTEEGVSPTKDLRIRRFHRVGGLLNMIEPGVINMVYFKDRKGWLRLIDRMKSNLKWQSFFLDEVEDRQNGVVGHGRPALG